MDELKALAYQIKSILNQRHTSKQQSMFARGEIDNITNKIIEQAEALSTRTPELPSPCTVEQWEEITGKTFPDDGAVWVREPITDPDITHMWYLLQYKTTKIGKAYPTFIVQTGKPAPKEGK